jgi:hypothetical protein
MTDPHDSEERHLTTPPAENVTQLTATNSQTINTVQITGSPGAVVSQVNHGLDPAATGILAGIFGVLLAVLAALPWLGKLVPSGLVVFLVGLSLALIVGGFFSWVESLLSVVTKAEIAMWLLGVNATKKVEPWPETFAKMFDQVFLGRNIFPGSVCGAQRLLQRLP